MRHFWQSLFFLRRALPLLAIGLLISPLSHAQTQVAGDSATGSVGGLSDSWSGELQDFAARVATLMPPRARIDLAVSNISSLSLDDATSVETSLRSLLTNRGFRLSGNESAAASVQVTISQNMEGFLLVAQVRHDGDEKLAIVSVPRAVRNAPTDKGVVLDAKLIWQQPAQILDFALPATQPGSQTIFAVLEPRRLAFYSQDWTQWNLVRELPSSSSMAMRDWHGHIDLDQGTGQSDARWPRNECKGDFSHPNTVNCQVSGTSSGAWILGSVSQPFTPNGGGDAVSIASQCRAHPIALATGGGDWTQPDFVQAYEMSGVAGTASGSPVNFEGPVTAIWPGDAKGRARVIVRNLRSGNYEAYVVTATCSQ